MGTVWICSKMGYMVSGCPLVIPGLLMKIKRAFKLF